MLSDARITYITIHKTKQYLMWRAYWC